MRTRAIRFISGLAVLAASVASANTVTISAVASLTGLAHFQSDVRVFNRSFDTSVHVTATYYCSISPCGNSPRSFDLPPRQSMAFDDIAANFFNAPGSQGAVTFQSDADELVATSRLYSVVTSGDFVGGSLGQFVPGLEDTDAFSLAVLTSLRNSSDPHTGFRTHVTAFNTSASATAHVSYSLFNGNGAFLGSFSASIAPHGFQPALAIFDVAGASATDTGNAYCAVSSSQPVFVAASILDNITEDTIFVTGSPDDQGPTPAYPTAAFDFSPANPSAGETVNFTDTSTGAPTSWSWNFGDQSPADTSQNPAHSFALAGNYFVTLTATNAGGSAEHTEEVTVDPAGFAPAANFSFSPSGPTAGQTVSFTDTSTGSPTTWAWNFGDPSSGTSNTSTSQNPSHAFAGPGDYTVALTAMNAIGPPSPTQKTVHVLAAPNAVTLNDTYYSPADITVNPGDTVTWTLQGNYTDHSVTDTAGAFDSGFIFTSKGTTYTHTFTAADAGKTIHYQCRTHGVCCGMKGTVTVNVTGSPIAAFGFAPPHPAAGGTVTFSDTSSGTPTSWSWNFGDPASAAANTSTSQNPAHTYVSANTYTVTLTATNSFGSSTPVTAQVTVDPAGSAPGTNFTFSPLQPETGHNTNFTDTSTGSPTSWSWDFGDPASHGNDHSTVQNPVHVFNMAGMYMVSLTAANANGPNTTTITVTVKDPPPPPPPPY